MLKKIPILVLLFISVQASSQIEKKYKLSDKIIIGGNFGFMFGSVTQIDLSPLVGYKITPKLISGLGFTFQYYRDNRWSFDDIETSIYGGRVFVKYAFIPQAFFQSEYEVLSLETKYFDKLNSYNGQPRFLCHSLLLGGGLKQQIGDRSSVNITILFNLIENANNPYSNPILRIGFEI